jgi:hypothetical protein
MPETDLDKLLQMLGLWDSEGSGKVVELGGQIRVDGKACSLAVSGDGSIHAVLFPGNALLQRRGSSAKIRLTRSELRAVIPILKYWKRRRHSLAYLDSSSAGYPAGMGGAWYYRPPGKDSKRKTVGSSCMGHGKGKSFTGVRELRPLSKPRRASTGVNVISETWHVGETSVDVPFEGVLVRETYRVARGLELRGEREEAILARLSWQPGAQNKLKSFAVFVREWKSRHRGRRPTPDAVWKFRCQQEAQIEKLASGDDGILLYPRNVPFLEKLLKLIRGR